MNLLLNRSKILMRCITGSKLYGTDTPSSDTDIRGVFVPPKEYFLGFMNKTDQIEFKTEDIVLYEIRKFLSLAAECNPNIIELLFIPESHILEITPEWELILENRESFLSTKCVHTFTGYAYSQLRRIKNHRSWLLNPPKKQPMRLDFGLEDKLVFNKTTIGAFNYIVAAYLDKIRQYHTLRESLEEMQETVDFKTMANYISDTKEKNPLIDHAIDTIIPLPELIVKGMEKEKSYRAALKHWNSYLSWKDNRNPDRAKMEKEVHYDVKHSLHLLRLLGECEELLIDRNITFPRPEREFLKDIKAGKISFESLLELAEAKEAKIKEISKASILPKKPNKKKIDGLCIKIVEDTIRFNDALEDTNKQFGRALKNLSDTED